MIKRIGLVLVLILAATSVLAASGPTIVSDNSTGLQVAIDPATGKLRQPTAAEMQQLSKSFTESLRLHPLVPRVAADGTLSLVLDDSSANFYIARLTESGLLDFTCVSDPASAIEVLTTPATQSIMWRGVAPEMAPRTPIVLEEK